jgi:hypothetical protein
MYKKCRNYEISTNSTIGVIYIKIQNNEVTGFFLKKGGTNKQTNRQKGKVV